MIFTFVMELKLMVSPIPMERDELERTAYSLSQSHTRRTKVYWNASVLYV